MDWLAISGTAVAGLCCLLTIVVVGGAMAVMVVQAGTAPEKPTRRGR